MFVVDGSLDSDVEGASCRISRPQMARYRFASHGMPNQRGHSTMRNDLVSEGCSMLHGWLRRVICFMSNFMEQVSIERRMLEFDFNEFYVHESLRIGTQGIGGDDDDDDQLPVRISFY